MRKASIPSQRGLFVIIRTIITQKHTVDIYDYILLSDALFTCISLNKTEQINENKILRMK